MTDYPTYTNRRATIEQIRRSSTFLGMHPKMQERVGGIIEASGGKVGLGQGLRPAAQQLQLFLSRHVPDPNGRYRYDGKRWRRLPGMAPAAPPGRSMHEIGLAADLVGDFDWVGSHAHEFSLQTFADVNNEPWHVQPSELPRGRSSYERNPAWGMPPWRDADGASTGSTGSTSSTASTSSTSSTASSSPTRLSPAYEARPGDAGPAVEIMIEALIARGRLDDVAASRDGRYDDDDRAIVESFQADHDLVVDGLVGPQTWGALLRTVEPDDTGPFVVVLQVTMIRRGLLRDTTGNRDGVYGAATQEVVGQFQAAAGLHVDRIAGTQTWTALIGEKRRVAVTTRDGASSDAETDEFDLDDIDILAVLDGVSCD